MRQAVTAIEERCIETRATFVHGGDLADPWKVGSHAAVATAVGMGHRLARAGLQSIWMPGNHDVIADGSGDHLFLAMRELEDVGVSVADRPCTLVLGSSRLHFLPFPNPAQPYDPRLAVRQLAELIPSTSSQKRDVFMGHLQVPKLIPGSEATEMPRGREVPWPLEEIAELFPNATLIAAHHHHACRLEIMGLDIHVIGSLGRLTFGETDHEPRYLEMTL